MPNGKAAPTLEDVAALAGVSTATVSRCLNAPDRVVARTRDRVTAAIETLGYTPNFAARVMAAKRTFIIGAVIPTMDNAIFARGLQAFQETLHTRGYTLLVSSSAYCPDFEKEQIRTLVARGADGLLLIGHDRDPDIYDYLDRQQVPALAAWSYIVDAPLPSVGFDNHAAMAGLVEMVIARGHRQIAMISGICHGNDRAQLRLAGVRAAVADRRDVNLDVVEIPYDIEKAAATLTSFMAQTPRPSVVLCGNDVIAAGAMNAAAHLGLDVPQDVSITGFDDIELARVVRPPLTTVHVPHRAMGQKAAEALITMVETKQRVASVLLPTQIVMRASLSDKQVA